MSKDKQTFGQWLYAARRSRKLTQQGLSDKTNGAVSKAYISLLETDRLTNKGRAHQPSQDALKAIARALDIPLGEAMQAAGWDITLPVKHMTRVHRIAALFEQVPEVQQVTFEEDNDEWLGVLENKIKRLVEEP